jgi:hypothetical protein
LLHRHQALGYPTKLNLLSGGKGTWQTSFRLKAKEVAERCCNVLSDGASLSFWKTCLSSAIERVRGSVSLSWLMPNEKKVRRMAKQQDELIKVVPVRLSELWRKGLAVYERLKEQLEREHWGKYVVIEPESGDYEVAPTRTEALLRMRQRHPDKVFVSRRIGFLDKKRW